MNGTVEQVSPNSHEAQEYFEILQSEPAFGITSNITKSIFRIISMLPSSEIHVFKDETQKVVGGILLSHFSTTVLQYSNIFNMQRLKAFIKLHAQGYKYAGYLVVNYEDRGKGFAELMWNIERNYYIFMSNPKKEEKVIREGGKILLDGNGEELYNGKSLYYKISKTIG